MIEIMGKTCVYTKSTCHKSSCRNRFKTQESIKESTDLAPTRNVCQISKNPPCDKWILQAALYNLFQGFLYPIFRCASEIIPQSLRFVVAKCSSEKPPYLGPSSHFFTEILYCLFKYTIPYPSSTSQNIIPPC